jgi:hypothetical protein
MKEIISISSHVNSEKKEKVLLECIDSLKSQGYSIILTSHLPVSDKALKEVDYFVYDKENALIYWYEYDKFGGFVHYWIGNGIFYFDKVLDYNHAYAVLKLYKNAAAIAYYNGYDIVHFIDYDYIINDKNLLKHHSQTLEENDAYFYDPVGFGGICSGFFSFKAKRFLDIFGKINSKEDYGKIGVSIFEHFLLHLSKENNIKYVMVDLNSIREKNEIDRINLGTPTGTIFTDMGDVVVLIPIKQGEEYYLLVYSNVKKDPNLSLIISKSSREFVIPIEVFPSVKAIEIPKEELESGMVLNISNMKINKTLDLTSNISSGEIKDKSVICKIF